MDKKYLLTQLITAYRYLSIFYDKLSDAGLGSCNNEDDYLGNGLSVILDTMERFLPDYEDNKDNELYDPSEYIMDIADRDISAEEAADLIIRGAWE